MRPAPGACYLWIVQPRSIALAAFSGVIFIALVYLSVKVNAKPDTGASSAELQQAMAYHKRNKRRTPTAAPTPPPSTRRSRVTRRRPRTTPSRDKTRRPPPDRPRPTIRRGKAVRKISINRGNRGIQLRKRMREANRAYDRQNYEEASKQALEILEEHPRNVRMLRVVVSSACFMGNEDQARTYYAKLPKRDKTHMRIRCARMKIKLDE